MALEPVVKKPALPVLALLLSYITELVFAFLVLILFLLATWGLHSCGEALGLVKTLFLWRLLELLVVSFGTLWCVVFFIKVSAEFFKKFKRHLTKPNKEFGDELSRLHPWDIVRRFGEPLHRQNLGLFICSVFIIIALLYVGISFAEIGRDDCDDVSLLACEIICETGPFFQEPIDDHVLMLTNYAKYMEHKHLPGLLLRLLFNHSPEKVLTALSETLSNTKGSQEEVANDIWQAGEEVMLFRLKALKLLPRGISLHEYRKIPEGLSSDIQEALEQSRKASRLFDEKPTMENAVHSCEANRKTMLLLFLARSSYNIGQNKLFVDFQGIVEVCRKSKIDVANRIQEDDDPRKTFLLLIAQSEQRRLEILYDIKDRDIQEAIERMWDAIEIAYSERTELLELCEKIRSAGNYSEKITP
ncbi:hypothetical protein ES703_38105 [subsurface metagenome]